MINFCIYNLHDGSDFIARIVALQAKILDLGNVNASIAAALGLRILFSKLRSGKAFHLLIRSPERYSGRETFPSSAFPFPTSSFPVLRSVFPTFELTGTLLVSIESENPRQIAQYYTLLVHFWSFKVF